MLIDRLEELLGLMEDEDEDEDEQEDALALTAGTAVPAPAAPAPEIEIEEGPENGVEKTVQALAESGDSLKDAEEPDRTQNRITDRMSSQPPDQALSYMSGQMPDQALSHMPGQTPDRALSHMPGQTPDQALSHMPGQTPDRALSHMPGQTPDQALSHMPGQTPDQVLNHMPSQTPDWASDRTLNWTLSMETLQERAQDDATKAAAAAESGAAVDGGVRRALAELWQDGLAVPVTRHDGTAVLRVPGAGDIPLTETAGTAQAVVAAAELAGVMKTMTAAEQGLEELYHWTAQASRPPAQSLPVEQAGRTLHAEEPGRTAALTVDELDRAVRRDSRRYDGGMSIF